jgi:uncharacterized protein YbaP (TraB family)
MRLIHRRTWTAFTLVVILCAETHAGEDGSKTFMWKATSPTNTVYLLGSIHAASDDFYPLADEIEKAFAESKKLVVEANIDDNDAKAKMTQLIAEKGVFGAGASLSKSLSKESLDALKAWCKENNLPVEQLDSYRPWLAALTITMSEFQKLGFKQELGIDLHFISAAKDKKPILELESLEGQLNLLSGFSDDLQDKFLLHSLTETADLKSKVKEMTEAWKTGNAQGMEDLMLKDTVKKHPELKPVLEKMLDERNVIMAEKIDGYLKGAEPHFVVVGAGHLIGEKGLVSLLSKKGYKVEQVKRASK